MLQRAVDTLGDLLPPIGVGKAQTMTTLGGKKKFRLSRGSRSPAPSGIRKKRSARWNSWPHEATTSWPTTEKTDRDHFRFQGGRGESQGRLNLHKNPHPQSRLAPLAACLEQQASIPPDRNANPPIAQTDPGELSPLAAFPGWFRSEMPREVKACGKGAGGRAVRTLPVADWSVFRKRGFGDWFPGTESRSRLIFRRRYTTPAEIFATHSSASSRGQAKRRCARRP